MIMMANNVIRKRDFKQRRSSQTNNNSIHKSDKSRRQSIMDLKMQTSDVTIHHASINNNSTSEITPARRAKSNQITKHRPQRLIIAKK